MGNEPLGMPMGEYADYTLQCKKTSLNYVWNHFQYKMKKAG